MSKRSSQNAINFSGKNWSVGARFSKSSKKKTKIENKQIKRDARRKKKFDLICEKFNFSISKIEDKLLYDKLLNDFLNLRSMKGSLIAKKSLENVKYFKKFCEKYNTKFDIQIYFEKNYNTLDFKNKYPEFIKNNC